MSIRFQQLALILGTATFLFLGSRVCSRLLAQRRPHRCQATIIPNLLNLPNQAKATKPRLRVRLLPKS